MLIRKGYTMTRTFLIAACLALFSSTLLAAKDDDSFRMAVVDVQKALNAVEEGKTAKAKLKKEFEKKQKEIEKRKEELEKLQTEIEGYQQKMASGLLSQEAMNKARKKEQDFRKKLEVYTEMVQNSQREFSQKEVNATKGIVARLQEMVVEIGRKEGFSMVLEKNQSGLLYAASYTDLTEKLIQTYNKKFKK